MIDHFRKYRAVLAAIIILLILIVTRIAAPYHFRPEPERWAKASYGNSNFIRFDKIDSLPGSKLLVNLGEPVFEIRKNNLKVLNIKADLLLEKNNYKIIRKSTGPVLLFSADGSVSARSWMLLSQMGIKNLFVLTSGSGREVFRYQFTSDTTSVRK